MMQVEEIVQQVTEIAKQHLPSGSSIVLFGSWARGNALPTSDIDIGFLGQNKIPLSTMIKIHEAIEQLPTLRSIDIVDLQSTDERFRTHVLEHAKFL